MEFAIIRFFNIEGKETYRVINPKDKDRDFKTKKKAFNHITNILKDMTGDAIIRFVEC